MHPTYKGKVLSLLTAVVLAGGCGEVPTAARFPATERPDKTLDGDRGNRARPAFGCMVSESSSGGSSYHYTHIGIRFPAQEVPVGSAGTLVRFRFQDQGAAPTALATCYIPASDAALARVTRRLVRASTSIRARADRPRPLEGGRLGTLDGVLFVDPKPSVGRVAVPPGLPLFDGGCVIDNLCSLPQMGDPVRAYSYPGYYWGGGSGMPAEQSAGSYYTYDDYGSGSGADPGTPPEGIADDQDNACHSNKSPDCNLQPGLTDQQRAFIVAGIQRIKTTGECGRARAAAENILNSGHFQVWTNTVRDDHGRVVLGDAGEDFVSAYGTEKYFFIHLWTEDMSAATIAHEALHTLRYNHESVINGMDMDRFARWCVS